MSNLLEQYKNLSKEFERRVEILNRGEFVDIYLCHIIDNNYDDEIIDDFDRRISNLDKEHPKIVEAIMDHGDEDYFLDVEWTKTYAPFARYEVKLRRQLLNEIILSLS